MNRKYRHRGYQDSGDDDRDRPRQPPRQALTQEERIQKRSLRHAIDRDARAVVRCHNCGRNVENSGTIAPTSSCPHCQAPMHCCRTCRFFDTASRHQCRAQIAQPVAAKSKPNECATYEPRLVLDVTGRRTSGSAARPSNDPRSQFENLFKS